MLKRTLTAAVAALLLVACTGERNPPTDAITSSERRPLTQATSDDSEHAHDDSPEPDGTAQDDSSRGASSEEKAIDPRTDGFEIALGEWAVTPETEAIRPGEVTFVIHNRGAVPHGFEIELEGESGGSGSGDLFKAESELLQPGESTRMTVNLTMTGTYKIECLVEGHDDMGMEGPLLVSEDAPLVPAPTAGSRTADASNDRVAIANFRFDPSKVEVASGTKVTWSNEDPAPHTVTGIEGEFDSGMLEDGDSFSFTFEDAGTYTYRCNVHPDMKGTVEVR